MSKVLATGYGVHSMLDVCHKNGWNTQNTDLEIEDPNDLDSKWVLKERERK